MAVDMNSSCEDAADIECTPTSKENGVINIDAGVDDVLDVPEYAEEIYQYMKEAEVCLKFSQLVDIDTVGSHWMITDYF